MISIRLSTRFALALVLGALGACGDPEQLPPSGVLITLDTTNAPALDVYGPDRGLTPHLSALAAESVVFERAHTVAPMTLPAHASMLTGLYPLRHGVRDNGLMRLSGEARTLAESAQEAGFETAAFIAAIVLSSPYGLDQGFDVFDEPQVGANSAVPTMSERSSTAITDAALAWLEQRDRDRPFFLWVHYFDPHHPYEPQKEFVELAKGNAYHAEVAAMDADIGRLLEALEAQVGYEELMIAVVADHGESFGRHGELTHSAFCYQATIQVPFFLRFPDGRRGGTRTQEVVSVVDLFPTFLEEMQLGAEEGIDGITLASGTVAPDRGVYVESYSGYLNYGWSQLAGWVDANGKYLHSSKPEFYGPGDAEEKNNLMGRPGGADVAPYLDSLEHLSKLPRLGPGGGLSLSAEQRASLQALGYAAAGDMEQELPDPLDEVDRPAPAERAAQYRKFTKALGLAQAGRNAPAIKLLREVLAENPGNVYALETLGGSLLAEKRYEETVEALEALAATGSERYWARACLGTAYEQLGKYDEALLSFEVAKHLRPEEPTVQQAIERVKAKLGAE